MYEHAYKRIVPCWLFDTRLSVRDRLTSSHPDAIQLKVMVATIPIISKPPSTLHFHQVQHAISHGELRRAHDLKANQREVHLIEVKRCEDTRPGHHLQASSKQHETIKVLEKQILHSTPFLLM